MNDIDIVRDFCAEEPLPGPQQLAEVRARVVAGFNGVQPGRPRSRVRAPRVLARPGSLLAGAAAMAAATAIAVGLVIPSGTASPAGSVRLDAALVLHRAARAALDAPTPGRDGYIYAKIQPRFRGPARPVGVNEWVSVTGAREGVFGPDCLAAMYGDCYMRIPARQGPAVFTYANLGRLPTAPGALLDYLYRSQARACAGGGLSGTRAQLELYGVDTVLTDVPVLPPRFGAALFNAAAQIRGTTVIGNVRTAIGPRAIAVVASGPPPLEGPGHVALLFNARTYQYMGSTMPSEARAHHVANGLVAASGFAATAPTGRVSPHNPPLYWQTCQAIPTG